MLWKIILAAVGGCILGGIITHLAEKDAYEAVDQSMQEALKKALRSDPEIDYPEPTEMNLDID